MKIDKILSQSRRDMQCLYKCEHCGHENKSWGYDDANFHNNVIPSMACDKCGKKADDNYRPLTTKYPEGMQV